MGTVTPAPRCAQGHLALTDPLWPGTCPCLAQGRLVEWKPLPRAEQLRYPQLGTKAGCTHFITALVKQKSLPDQGKEKRPRFHLERFWVFPMPTVAGLVPVHSRLAGESLTSCKDVQGPASVPVHTYGLYNIHTSLGEDDQNQPRWRGRVGRHPWLRDGVVRPLKMHMKHGVQWQTRWVLSSIAAPGAGQPELSPKPPFSPTSHVPFPPPRHAPPAGSTRSAQSRSSPGFV